MQKTDFDTNVRPQDDYFGYVNNNWLAANPIPKTETNWGTFYVLRDQAWKAVDDIVQKLLKTDDSILDHDQKLLKQLFTSSLNYTKHEKQHLATLQKLMTEIVSIKDASGLAFQLGYLHRLSIDAFWELYVSQDDKDSSNQLLRFYQGGLSLPNRDYYIEKSARMRDVRAKYTAYYREQKELLPKNSLGCRRKTFRIEKQLAEASWTNVELRDVQKNYTRMTQAKMAEKLGEFDWGAYWKGLGWQNLSDDIAIDQFTFMEKVVSLLASAPLEEIKAYLRWRVVNSFAGWLSKPTSERSFDFYGKVLSGQKAQKPLWKRAVLQADRLVVGEALGREYARQHFPESSKQVVLDLVEDIRRVYHQRIDRLTWMSESTKKRAHTKLDNLKVFIGYPSVWKDFSKLNFADDNVLENLMAAKEFETDLALAKVGKKPAEEDWEMNAHTVNAYHHPSRMEIVFPAAILQAPFFSPEASNAANLGGIGSVIGHEFTHGFDDQGCQYDENGNTHPWQSDKEQKAFHELAATIVQQADSFETVPGVFLQGNLILGEAIADVGGLTLAVEALGDASEKDLQELFVNFATCERGHTTHERAVELAKTDPHPPSPFRVNCVVNHVDKFYDSYNVTPSDKLYLAPAKRSKIW